MERIDADSFASQDLQACTKRVSEHGKEAVTATGLVSLSSHGPVADCIPVACVDVANPTAGP